MSLVISFVTPNYCLSTDTSLTLTVRGANFTPDTSIIFGDQKLSTKFIDSTFLTTDVPLSYFSNTTLGDVSISVVNSVDTSNIVTFKITKNSPVTVQEINNLVNGLDLSSVETTNDQNQYLKKIPNLQAYVIQDNDTLQSIAARVMGDASQWFDIAVINKLRYPFISNNPSDSVGATNGTGVLTRNVTKGQSVVYLGNNSNQFVSNGSVLYFYLNNAFANSSLTELADNVTVVNTNLLPSTFELQVNLDSPLSNNYNAGTSINVLNTYVNATSKVAKTGDAILVPANTPNYSIVRSNSLSIDNIDTVLGTDISLSPDGFLSADNNGDIGTVSGFQNLNQALSNRLNCPTGELVYHMDYGNPLLDYIGAVNTPTLAILAKGEVSKTILRDPRVSSINSITVSVDGDTTTVQGEVYVSLLNSSTNFQFVT